MIGYYDKKWVDEKVDDYLYYMQNNIPLMGETLVALIKGNPRLLLKVREIVIQHFQNMKAYAFVNLKKAVYMNMSADDYDFSPDVFRELITNLEMEYAQCFPELGIENSSTIDYFAKTQSQWFNEHWSWTYSTN